MSTPLETDASTLDDRERQLGDGTTVSERLHAFMQPICPIQAKYDATVHLKRALNPVLDPGSRQPVAHRERVVPHGGLGQPHADDRGGHPAAGRSPARGAAELSDPSSRSGPALSLHVLLAGDQGHQRPEAVGEQLQ